MFGGYNRGKLIAIDEENHELRINARLTYVWKNSRLPLGRVKLGGTIL